MTVSRECFSSHPRACWEGCAGGRAASLAPGVLQPRWQMAPGCPPLPQSLGFIFESLQALYVHSCKEHSLLLVPFSTWELEGAPACDWCAPCKLAVAVAALPVPGSVKEVPKSDQARKPRTVLDSELFMTQNLPCWLNFLAAAPTTPLDLSFEGEL